MVPGRDTDAPRPQPGDDRAQAAASAEAARHTTLTTPIYFAYDSDALSAEAHALLELKWTILSARPDLTLILAGHTDERGSDEYNIALGRRRAEATKQWFVDRGLAAERFTTISFGRERPAVAGTTESAWQRNRRTEFRVHAP